MEAEQGTKLYGVVNGIASRPQAVWQESVVGGS